MNRKLLIVKINFPGGIIPAGDLLSIAEAATAADVRGIRFGRRQQVLLEVPSDRLTFVTTALENNGLPVEIDTDHFPNIVSGCVAEQAIYPGAWLKEGVYKDVLDSFDYHPRLSVNLVDKGQNLVPYHTGRLNFIASGIGNYWYLLWRLSPEGRLLEWRSLVYSGNIARLVQRLEAYLLDTPIRDELTIYQEIMRSELWVEQPPREPLSFPDFSLPYYEGFNRSQGERLWLGIYRRDERFAPGFVSDMCKLCLRTKIGQLHSTPWKSLIIPGIAAEDRKLWDIVLGRHGINVRHSLGELSWQIEELSDEGLSLKRYLVRQFDRDDVRTFGLYFGIQLEPGAGLYPLILIRKETSRRTYQILYKKDFDLRADDYILFRSQVEKENLAPYLKSLSKYFYECRAGEEQLLHHVFRESEIAAKAGEAAAGKTETLVYQCRHCGTVYDTAIGDPDYGIPAGTLFHTIDEYHCPVCDADKTAFSPRNSNSDGILCI